MVEVVEGVRCSGEAGPCRGLLRAIDDDSRSRAGQARVAAVTAMDFTRVAASPSEWGFGRREPLMSFINDETLEVPFG